MTNAELLAKIKAEIERRKMESIGFRNNEKREDWASFFNGEATALENLLSFLSTLESEKPMNQDGLKNEIERFFKDEGWDEYWKWVERPYQLMFGKTVIKFASNFYELGCRRTAEKYDEIEYNRQRFVVEMPNNPGRQDSRDCITKGGLI